MDKVDYKSEFGRRGLDFLGPHCTRNVMCTLQICTISDSIRGLWLLGGYGMVGVVGLRMESRQDLGVVLHIWEAFLSRICTEYQS